MTSFIGLKLTNKYKNRLLTVTNMVKLISKARIEEIEGSNHELILLLLKQFLLSAQTFEIIGSKPVISTRNHMWYISMRGSYESPHIYSFASLLNNGDNTGEIQYFFFDISQNNNLPRKLAVEVIEKIIQDNKMHFTSLTARATKHTLPLFLDCGFEFKSGFGSVVIVEKTL